MMRTGKIKGALLAFVLALVAACGVACGGTTSDAKIVITGAPENGVVTLTDSVNTLQLGYELSEGKGDVGTQALRDICMLQNWRTIGRRISGIRKRVMNCIF